jgi:4-hydroxy-3-polyprenylbenzoate decarboxylase
MSKDRTIALTRRIVIALTGASGAVYGVRLLEMLKPQPDIEAHVIISKAAHLTLSSECNMQAASVARLADVVHAPSNIGAAISSGSFRVDGMIIAPCSINTASRIAAGITDDLVSRSADVMLKERRPLIVAIRETPLHAGHLETCLKLARLGVVIFPPVPSFYHQPAAVGDIVDQSCMRMLDQLDIRLDEAPRWGEAGGITAIGSCGGGHGGGGHGGGHGGGDDSP